MLTRRRLLQGGLGVLGAGAAAMVYQARQRPDPQYNVVLLLLDDVHPSGWTRMPHLRSKPSGRWVRFTNSIATFPLCRPSRATILTGQLASRHGLVTNNEPPEGLAWMRAHEQDNLLWWMHLAGYQVGYFGKYLNAYPFDPVDPGYGYRPPGVDRWHANGDNRYSRYAVSEDGGAVLVDEADAWTGIGYSAAARSGRSGPTGYRTDRTADELNTWVATVDEPFVAIGGHTCPHVDRDGVSVPGAARHADVAIGPVDRGAAFDEGDVSDKPGWVQDLPPLDAAAQRSMDAEQTGQWRSLLAFDESIYDLMAVLADREVLDRTVLIVLADNGQLLGEHRSRSKAQPYREALAGELWVRHPEATSRDDGAVVANVDIAPTLCDLTGATPTTAFDGTSLLPLVLDRDAPWRDRILIESVNPAGADGVGYPGFVGWVSRREKYVELEAFGSHPPEAERYDLTSDPWELTNLGPSDRHADVLADLRG